MNAQNDARHAHNHGGHLHVAPPAPTRSPHRRHGDRPTPGISSKGYRRPTRRLSRHPTSRLRGVWRPARGTRPHDARTSPAPGTRHPASCFLLPASGVRPHDAWTSLPPSFRLLPPGMGCPAMPVPRCLATQDSDVPRNPALRPLASCLLAPRHDLLGPVLLLAGIWRPGIWRPGIWRLGSRCRTSRRCGLGGSGFRRLSSSAPGLRAPEFRHPTSQNWRSGGLAVWRSGGLAVWRSGGLAVWRSGGLAVWRSGGLAIAAIAAPQRPGSYCLLPGPVSLPLPDAGADRPAQNEFPPHPRYHRGPCPALVVCRLCSVGCRDSAVIAM
jgi:hypothetical protein